MGRKKGKGRHKSSSDVQVGLSAKARRAQSRKGVASPTYGHAGLWWESARPKTLWAGFAPVLIGCAIAWADKGFHGSTAFFCLLLGISVQIGTNYSNDYYDFIKGSDTEERKGPRRATASGLVKPGEMLRASWVCFAITIMSGTILAVMARVPMDLRWIILVGTVICVLCGIAYTGGPFPIGYNGLGDLFAFFFFGPVAVIGTYWMQVGALPQKVILASLAPGLFATALLAVNNLRDTDTDKKSGKRTLAVLLGKGFARIEYISCAGVGCLLPIVYARMENSVWPLLALATVFLAVSAIGKLTNQADANQLNQVLATTGKMELLYALLFSLGVALSVIKPLPLLPQ